MTDLEQKIRACAEAVLEASLDDVKAATWALGDDLMADGEPIETILDGIRFTKRMQVRIDAGGMIFHVAWADGAAATFESEEKVSLADLMKSLIGKEGAK